ncbi:hypothetical protein APA_3308 [Pseudanabaena sp. lw0831]|uniref:type VII toxin-antitoxin system HepT family RNase toxin n=1 Tax=Pseudanabaena sp. lw0831 TaxID=1357935 RepID=UPI0019164344|nr:DUF86 domain-containing protein [Pseudanabaena sp. lw0831]GBO55258.1 hypothetical protein APA_3308 [Pseudanabaena sp. lw0831]
MKEINPEVVRRKLDEILDYINDLKSFEMLSLEEFLSERYRQFTIERIMELIVQAAIDINRYLLKKKGVNPSSLSSYKTFVEIGNLGIITESLAEVIKQSIDTRNALAHRYDDISPEEVFEEIADILEKYPIYARQVSTFLESLDENPEESI